jgi:hypothetical protein
VFQIAGHTGADSAVAETVNVEVNIFLQRGNM